MGEHGFPREKRLVRSADFRRLSRDGRKVTSPHFILLYVQPGTGRPRLGVTVSRKVGDSVRRNRVKRLLREFFRHQIGLVDGDYSVIARKGAAELPHHQAWRELEVSFARAVGSKCPRE